MKESDPGVLLAAAVGRMGMGGGRERGRVTRLGGR